MTFLHVLIWVNHHLFHIFIVLLSSSMLLSIHLIRFTLLFFFYNGLFQVWYFFPHHSYTSHYQFDFLHCFLTTIIFTLDNFKSMAYEPLYTCCILYARVWVWSSICMTIPAYDDRCRSDFYQNSPMEPLLSHPVKLILFYIFTILWWSYLRKHRLPYHCFSGVHVRFPKHPHWIIFESVANGLTF